MTPLSAYSDFKAASNEVLHFLHSRLGFRLWMVTRTKSSDWIVLNANDHGYNVHNGDAFLWSDSYCSRMVQGLGPRIAPKSNEVPAYAAAPIGQKVSIGAYIGVPLTRTDGQLFGTLCAIDPHPMPEHITGELPLIEVMARLLMTVLENELAAQDEHRRAEHATADAMTDQLTGLYNRRGWQVLNETEEIRCQRYAHPACVFSIDLDGLKIVNDTQGHAQGDLLLCQAAGALKSVARQSDVVARIGGDEFALLAVECDVDGALALVKRLEQVLREANVSASIGMSMRRPAGCLTEAFDQADKKMYECKNQRKAALERTSDSRIGHRQTKLS